MIRGLARTLGGTTSLGAWALAVLVFVVSSPILGFVSVRVARLLQNHSRTRYLHPSELSALTTGGGSGSKGWSVSGTCLFLGGVWFVVYWGVGAGGWLAIVLHWILFLLYTVLFSIVTSMIEAM